LKTNELLDPRKPENMMKIVTGKVKMQYFTKEEEHQRTYELKLMYGALPYIVSLGDDSLENVRNHVKMNKKVQDLSKFTDPVAFGNHFDQFSSTQQDSNLHKEVSNSRSDAQKQANQNRLQEINNQIKQLNSVSKGPEINSAPEPQLQSAPNVSKPAAPVIGP
jgi:hypothetical protein